MTRLSNPITRVVTGVALAGVSLGAFAFQALPEKAPEPADNPGTAAKIELGKQLYFDPRLSLDGTVSCNSCHNVMASGTDNKATSAGVAGKHGGRSAPTVWNSAFLSVQFWDGRADTLEDQAKGPILNPVEMAMPSEKAVMDRLQQIPGYVTQFKAVFGDDGMTYDNLAKAIGAFERILITPNAPLDRYLKGDKSALSAAAKRGMQAFEEVGCNVCHAGANFSGPALPVGQGFYRRFPTFDSKYDSQYQLKADAGRYEATGKEADKHMWRVPTLRNISLTAPYFHHGAVKTLDEAVRVMAKTQLSKELTDQQVTDIVAFLDGLTGEFPQISMPRLPVTANRSLVD
ncbi:MAG TPA: cytochrome-c peroxidase [Gammaproteobacteria bacterium]|nr:cytochrome-c peroxidase [Gammaproteobacteria bacterium]